MDTYEKLRARRRKDLEEIHDKETANVVESIQFIREELRHREIRRYTQWITGMTLAITVATILNVVLWAVDKLSH